jgi:hypothetical protein
MERAGPYWLRIVRFYADPVFVPRNDTTLAGLRCNAAPRDECPADFRVGFSIIFRPAILGALSPEDL